MNEIICVYCAKPVYANQAWSRVVHKKCYMAANLPNKPCWECRGEGSYKVNERQRVSCPRCKGTGKIR